MINKISDEIIFSIPRNIKQRGFSFSPLQYLALDQIAIHANLFSSNTSPDNKRVGILLGSESGGFHEYFKQGKKFYGSGLKRVSPLTIPRTIHNTGSAVLAIEHEFQGVSAGYNGDASIGLVTFLDSILALETKEQDLMIFGTGERIRSLDSSFIEEAVLGVVSKIPFDNSFSFSVKFSLGRGKPWLSESENRSDLIDCAKNSMGDLPEKIFHYSDSTSSNELNTCINLEKVTAVVPELKSLGPILGFEYCLNNCNDFVYIVTTKDGFGIILIIHQDNN